MSAHFITQCSCGAIIAQCRCPGKKAVTVVPNGCKACKVVDPIIQKIYGPKQEKPLTVAQV